MSGGLSVPLAGIAVWAPITWIQVTFGVTAFICTWAAAFSIWTSERNAFNKVEVKVAELRRRLAPKIHIDNARVLPVLEENGLSCKWAQFIVQGITDAPLNQCEVWLEQVDFLHTDAQPVPLMDESLRCDWSLTNEDERYKLNIASGSERAINLFSIAPEGKPIALVEFRKHKLQKGIEHPGRYRLVARVTASDSQPAVGSFIFEWQDFDNISLTQERGL